MRDSDRARTAQAEFLLLLAVVIWATNYSITKYGIQRLDMFVFNAIRYVVAALLLAVLVFTRSSWTPVARSDWPGLIRAGVVANIVYQVAFIIGLSLTTAGNSAVLLATSPLWTIVIGSATQREKIRREIIVGMGISLLGIVLIIAGSGKEFEFDSRLLIGDVICIAAAFMWAYNTNLQKPLVGRYPPSQVTFIMVCIGAVGLSIAAVPGIASLTWEAVDPGASFAALCSGALSIAVANVIWSVGVKRLGPGRTANFGNLIPVIALIASFVILGERLLPMQLLGAAVTIFGVWYVRRR